MPEHKSQSRRFDALQILEQVTAVLRTHRREHPRDRFLPAVLPVVLHADTRPWRSPRNVRDLFDTLADYVFATSGLPTPVVQRLLTRRFTDPTMRNECVSTAQQLRNEGKAEGRASTLLRLITRRFGEPVADVVERTRDGTLDELDHWLDRILDAASLDERFAD